MMYNMRLFMLRMSSVNMYFYPTFSPCLQCTCSIHHVWFTLFLSTSLFNAFLSRRLFSRVFSLLLCHFVLCFLQYSFTLSVWSRVFIGTFFYWCVSCVAKHTTSSVWSPRVVFIIVFHCVSLSCVEYDLDKYSIYKPFSLVITNFI